MKKNITAVIAIGILVFVAAACSGSFTSANISELRFGKNEKADPASTTFNTGENIYAVATVSNASGKNKLTFKITYENVTGKSKGEAIGEKTTDVEGSMVLWQQFSTPLPGEYKVEVTLNDDTGKKIDSKIGNLTVKGSAPTATSSDDKKKDSDDDSQ